MEIRGVHRPAWSLPVLVVATAAIGLYADSRVGVVGQGWLGAGCTVLFCCVLVPCSRGDRHHALAVVAVATAFEVLGSRVWGLYVYRLDNLPLFVPAGHGLVFLSGLHLSRTAAWQRHGRVVVGFTVVCASLWCVVGALALVGHRDLAGVPGTLLVVLMLWRGRQAGLFAGVWWLVALLELYGTALGTWTWAETVPGLGLAAGNPPSGVASGYVVFDWLAAVLLTHPRRDKVARFPREVESVPFRARESLGAARASGRVA